MPLVTSSSYHLATGSSKQATNLSCRLATLTGPGNKENFTMHLTARKVLEGSQKDVEIIGPVTDGETGFDRVVMKESDVYWRTTRPKTEEQLPEVV
jgi:hypothetical protein